MSKYKIPVVYPIQEGEFVTIPTSSWNTLCETVNSIIEAVNATTNAVDSMSSDLDACKLNVAKIAEITEEIYETLA
jgi:hypothetical protein